jgi:acylphosphatase
MSDPLRTVAGADSPECRVLATVAGRVQGVGFRAWTQAQAEALGVRGWVRNRNRGNGDVEALFCGPPLAVQKLCARLMRGPPAARVDHVNERRPDESELALAGDAGFRQIATI